MKIHQVHALDIAVAVFWLHVHFLLVVGYLILWLECAIVDSNILLHFVNHGDQHKRLTYDAVRCFLQSAGGRVDHEYSIISRLALLIVQGELGYH